MWKEKGDHQCPRWIAPSWERVPSWGEGAQRAIRGDHLPFAHNQDNSVGSGLGDPHGIKGMGALPTAVGAERSTLAVEHQENVGRLGNP